VIRCSVLQQLKLTKRWGLWSQECVRLEKSRDGCPKVVNLGASRQDAFYERKKSKHHLFRASIRWMIQRRRVPDRRPS